jgi:hypothetical protein
MSIDGMVILSNKLQKMWKEAIVALYKALRYLSGGSQVRSFVLAYETFEQLS